MKIVLIGSGNVATDLGKAFQKGGHEIVQVYSNTAANATKLAKELKCDSTSKVDLIYSKADVYFVAIKDDMIETFAKKFNWAGRIMVHTCASLPMDVFKNSTKEYGVFYPLQSFNKERKLNLSTIPVFIEANSAKTKKVMKELAKCISDKTYEITYEQRLTLHAAAVFANNFTNHLYKIASDILRTSGLEFDVLKPLIKETADKVMTLDPAAVQTGPAQRKDVKTIKKHFDLLKNFPAYQNIYEQLTESIERQSR
ncbi:MAG: Rossmann-like and DUF2520 domain-containing protein [Bacteroidota bacterium]